MRFNKLLLLFFLSMQAGDILGQQSIPIFANKSDSAQFAIIWETINRNWQKGTAKPETIDSLLHAQKQLANKIIGFRIIYRPATNFTSYQDLKDGKVRPEDVTRLSFADNKLGALPEEIYKCQQLKELELVNTSVKKLGRSLRRLPRLQGLYVYNNTISGKLKLGRNITVTKLVLTGIRSENLPRSFKKFKGVDSLELSRNIGMTSFPRISRNKTLVKLNLIENNITLSDLKRGSTSLLELNLIKNKIEKVPEGISKFPNLRKLNLNNNLIHDIHPAIGRLKKMETLSLYQNKLASVPMGIFGLSSLVSIDLYYNNIQRIDPAISKLGNLRILYLSNNQLTALPETLGSLTNLTELYVHDNKLDALPGSVLALNKLRVLRINNNNIVTLPGSLSNLANLENLDVSRNYLNHFPVEWEGLSNLHILSVIGNPWENKDDMVRVMHTLQDRGVVCLYLEQ